jgi:hypothetical protein
MKGMRRKERAFVREASIDLYAALLARDVHRGKPLSYHAAEAIAAARGLWRLLQVAERQPARTPER